MQRVRSESVNAIQTLRETQYAARRRARRARGGRRACCSPSSGSFAAGTSTTFLVLQRQLDVANNEGRELQAQTDLNKAVVQAQPVAGTNFATYNIDVQHVGTTTLDADVADDERAAAPARRASFAAAASSMSQCSSPSVGATSCTG